MFLLNPYSFAAQLYLDALAQSGHFWGLRKARAGYTGDCIELRRSTDAAVESFGFAGNFYDKAEIISWLGGATGNVRRIFDQGGAIDFQQTTTGNMPVLDTVNDKIVFDGASDRMTTPTTLDLSATDKVSFFLVAQLANTAGNQAYFEHGDYITDGSFIHHLAGSNFNIHNYKGPNNSAYEKAANTNKVLSSAVLDRSLDVNNETKPRTNANGSGWAQIGGSANVAGNFPNKSLHFGSRYDASMPSGMSFFELSLFPVAFSDALRAIAEANIMSYHAIS